jgi:DNA-directed RNA polymerase specialized sigma24 family protein
MLGISEGTSKSNLSRARVILRDKIELSRSSIKKNEAF